MTQNNFLVTRPAKQGEGLCAKLQAAGFSAVNVPVMEIEPLPLDQNLFSRLQSFDFVIVVSLNAAEQFIEAIKQYPLAANSKVLTVGKTTATFLAEYQITTQFPPQQMDSEGLLALDAMSPENVQGKNVLIVRGEGGRQKLAETLTERQANVSSVELYRRFAPLQNQTALREALAISPVIVINSGESLDNFEQIVAMDIEDFLHKTLIVPGVRVAELAKARGFTQVLCAANATDDAVLEVVLDNQKRLLQN